MCACIEINFGVNVQAYASCIGVLSVASREPLASLFRRHLSCVLFVTWAVYVYRDIWPLATYTLQPADAAEGLVLWIGIAALTVASVIVPLIIPRVYAPSESVVRRKFSSAGAATPDAISISI